MAKAQEQKGFFGGIRDGVVNFYRETMGELRKVVWPTWLEARNLTIIVLVVIFVMAAILGSFDWLFAQLVRLLVNIPV
jgi:preprotein translocase subunit SecE